MSNVKAPVRVGDPLWFVLPDERVICAKVTNIVPSRGRTRWTAFAADDRMSYSTQDLPYFFSAMRAEGYAMRKRLERVLKDCPSFERYSEGVWLPWIAEHLIEQGVLCPPLQIGQTVFAAYMDEDEPVIEEWVVRGIGIRDGVWYAAGSDPDEFEFGRWGCLPTREEAEQLLQKEEKDNGTFPKAD